MDKESQIQLKIKKLCSFIPPVADIAAAAATIPEKLVIEPTIPVGIFIQEALNIHLFMQDDRDLLVSKGMNWGIVDELPDRIKYLQTCETLWWKARFSPSPVAKEFLKIKELAIATASELIRDLEYLGSDDENLTKAIKNIKKGIGDEDLFNDLKSLSILCENHRDSLTKTGSNPQLIKALDDCCEKFPLCYAPYKVDVTDVMALYDRNCAYTFTLVAVEEIRRCARHVFWNDKKHLKGYLSDYFRRRGE
ncbi:MAG TPA: hypothetical protein VHO70_01590 [Chitinispirillaceae bacterium]|nr:hypothetical protein [Chitinispirillaceae bacterium]